MSVRLNGGIARLLSGLGDVLGQKRFDVLLGAAGHEDAERDWEIIGRASTFEEGFVLFAEAARVEGWGVFGLVSLDRDQKKARFRVERREGESCPASNSSWGAHFMAGKLAGLCSRLFGVYCSAFTVSGEEFVVEPSSERAAETLQSLLARERARGAELSGALEKLEREVEVRVSAEEDLKFEIDERKLVEENLKFEVAERREMELELREKLRLIQDQRDAIQRMSVPIIEVWDGVLALPVVGPISAERAAQIMDQLLAALVASCSAHVIIDLTGAELADVSTTEHILRIARAVELMGAQGSITGIRPETAQAMTTLGLDLGRVKTLRNLREGLRECMKATRRGLPKA